MYRLALIVALGGIFIAIQGKLGRSEGVEALGIFVALTALFPLTKLPRPVKGFLSLLFGIGASVLLLHMPMELLPWVLWQILLAAPFVFGGLLLDNLLRK